MTTISAAAQHVRSATPAATDSSATPIEPATPTEQYSGKASTETANESMLHWGIGGSIVGTIIGLGVGTAAERGVLGFVGALVGGIAVYGGIAAGIGGMRANGTEHAKYIARLDATTGEATLKYAERMKNDQSPLGGLYREADTSPHDANLTAEELAHSIARYDTDRSGTLTGAEKKVLISDYWDSGFREPNPRH